MIELQRKLIGDKVRNDAFALALKQSIKKGISTVIDLGSGTGFLGFLASRYGAKNVTCIESGEIVKISRALAKRNRITNCIFIARHSTEIKDLPKADILVSETLGNYALEENIIESIEDAKRFLKPDAIIIPAKLYQYVCPVVSDRLHKEIDVWDAGYDIQFDEAREKTLHNIYVKTVKKEDLLEEKDAVRPFDIVDFSKKNKSVRHGKEEWIFSTTTTTVYGFALWWNAELIEGVSLSTSPYEKPTHWEQIYLPLLSSVSLQAGDHLIWKLASDSRWKTKINLVWTVTHNDAAGKKISEQALDMRKGY